MGTNLRLTRPGANRAREIELIERSGSTIRVRIDGIEMSAEAAALADGGMMVTVGNRRFRTYAARRRDAIMVAAGSLSATFLLAPDKRASRRDRLATPEVTAPMPGKVLKIMTSAGARVAPGDPLIVLEAMKMETTLRAEGAAEVKKIRVGQGQMVDHGAVLLELAPISEPSAPQSVDPTA